RFSRDWSSDVCSSDLTDSRSAVYESTGEGKYKLDLQQLNRQIMIKAGILPSNIEVTKMCTSCHTAWFFSHRAEAGKTGRMVAWKIGRAACRERVERCV